MKATLSCFRHFGFQNFLNLRPRKHLKTDFERNKTKNANLRPPSFFRHFGFQNSLEICNRQSQKHPTTDFERNQKLIRHFGLQKP